MEADFPGRTEQALLPFGYVVRAAEDRPSIARVEVGEFFGGPAHREPDTDDPARRRSDDDIEQVGSRTTGAAFELLQDQRRQIAASATAVDRKHPHRDGRIALCRFLEEALRPSPLAWAYGDQPRTADDTQRPGADVAGEAGTSHREAELGLPVSQFAYPHR